MEILYCAAIKTCVVVHHLNHLAVQIGSNEGAKQVFMKPTGIGATFSLAAVHTFWCCVLNFSS